MREKPSQQLYRYWREIRGDRIAPRRVDVEPSRISGLLGTTFVLECLPARPIRYRIAGSEMCDTFGIEFHGLDFLAHFTLNDRLALRQQLSLVLEYGAVLIIEIEASPEDRRAPHHLFEFVMLPLQQSEHTIDQILGIATCVMSLDATNQSGGVGVSLTRWRIKDRRVIWNEQHRPVDLDEALFDACETPNQTAACEVRQARIVRKDQRRFRVYDGGTKRSPNDNQK